MNTMWYSSKSLTNHVKSLASSFLVASNGFLSQQTRNTFILKRRIPPGLHKKNSRPKPLRPRHYLYDLVEDTSVKQKPNLEVILTTYVNGLGDKGDRVSLKPYKAYTELLLPGLAVYPTPEFCEKYENKNAAAEAKLFSSPHAERTIHALSIRTLGINMSSENPWVLEKWHVRSAFRVAGFHMPDDAITMPEKPISGPDSSIEGKEFYVTITVNKTEQVKVRCRIYYWKQNSPSLPEDFYKEIAEPVFPEDQPILDSLPRWTEQSKSRQF
ncbi:39S ribosomal protein L9, mitochondrial [Athalia rosae]|uniref:39S ribosomal protein L9, mitochondrial n=1 Tax=Athalia rosae TaxID=37344 RepID=UPI002033CA74|nr:39S ribosomal protein L9, mitochondrial [Athalia rosae]